MTLPLNSNAFLKGNYKMNENIPKDPVLLLSYVNMKLRDFYPTLDDLCASLDIDKAMVIQKLSEIDYLYDSGQNQFI